LEAKTSIFVVGVDGSDHSLVALRRAVEEAEAHGANLHAVHVAEPVTGAMLHLPDDVNVSTTELAADRREEVWANSEQVLESASGSTERVDLEGQPAEAIVEYCSSVNASLLIVGTRGRGRIATALLGSTAMAAIQDPPCDVLVARTPQK
jgi:nucleotide-binding universal stress UspA family protein